MNRTWSDLALGEAWTSAPFAVTVTNQTGATVMTQFVIAQMPV